MREWTSGITESLNRKCRVARAAFNQTDASASVKILCFRKPGKKELSAK